MKKNVKVTVSSMMPITSIGAPLTRGTHGPVILSCEDIFKCLIHGASVKEILADNSEVLLTLSNYNTDNEVKETNDDEAFERWMQEQAAKESDDKKETEDSESESPSLNELSTESDAEPTSDVDSTSDTQLTDDIKTEVTEPAVTESPAHWAAPNVPPQQRSNGKNKGNHR